MGRSLIRSALLITALAGGVLSAPARAQAPAPLAGIWSLNRARSEFPADIGFNPEWMTAAAAGDGQPGSAGNGGGRGRRGSGGGGGGRAAPPFPARPESYEDARRAQLLTAEVRAAAARLMIVETPSAVTITNELGQSRTVHPDGHQESIEIQGLTFSVTSKRDGNQLTIDYRVDQNREIRYTYAATAGPSQLVVYVQFLDHGKGDNARRIYEPGTSMATATPATTAAATVPAFPGQPAPGQPAPGQPAPDPFDQRPGAELRGLTTLGILVETLSPQAIACGLAQNTVEDALAKRLTSGGFTVRRNSDDDTYVYVNIMTTSLPSGMCASRYDTFLYTHATAKLSYRDQPVLVQVSLMHRGGIGTSVPTAHSAAVVRGLEGYIDLFVTQVHDANK
jgi:hypothetical protein